MTATASEEVEGVEAPAVSRVEWAPVARVNLLPKEIGERRRFRRVQQGLAFVVVATLCGAGAAVWWSELEVSNAQTELDTVQARTADLQKRRDDFADVPRVTAQVRAAEDARATAMTNDVPWYRYMTDLEAAAPEDVSFIAFTFTVPGAASAVSGAAAAAPDTNPLAPANGVGAITLDGISGEYPQISRWLLGLDDVAGLDVSTLANAATKEDRSGITFSSGITVTDEALSHRYDRKAS
jgi:Tfp pilus assembly protein PilN